MGRTDRFLHPYRPAAKRPSNLGLGLGQDQEQAKEDGDGCRNPQFSCSGCSSCSASRTLSLSFFVFASCGQNYSATTHLAQQLKLLSQASDSDSEEEEEEDLPTLTPSAHRFSLLPPLSWPSLFSAISSDPTLLTEETSDALMVEAFNQGMKQTAQGKERAKNCVEKALVGQYCRSLGRDGVRLFFQR